MKSCRLYVGDSFFCLFAYVRKQSNRTEIINKTLCVCDCHCFIEQWEMKQIIICANITNEAPLIAFVHFGIECRYVAATHTRSHPISYAISQRNTTTDHIKENNGKHCRNPIKKSDKKRTDTNAVCNIIECPLIRFFFLSLSWMGTHSLLD